MCGRYGRRADKQRIAEWMQTHNTNVFEDTYLAPSYNVAPQSMQPVVRLDRETGERELTIMRWGLIPYWSKESKIGYSTTNAKAETITTSPAFREAMKRRRCLVPADWFYEWVRPVGCSDDCPAWPHGRTCRPIGSTLGGQAVR
jgi:putative SOS response-associated peptidase YedK